MRTKGCNFRGTTSIRRYDRRSPRTGDSCRCRSGSRANGRTRAVLLSVSKRLSSAFTPGDLQRRSVVGAFSLRPPFSDQPPWRLLLPEVLLGYCFDYTRTWSFLIPIFYPSPRRLLDERHPSVCPFIILCKIILLFIRLCAILHGTS